MLLAYWIGHPFNMFSVNTLLQIINSRNCVCVYFFFIFGKGWEWNSLFQSSFILSINLCFVQHVCNIWALIVFAIAIAVAFFFFFWFQSKKFYDFPDNMTGNVIKCATNSIESSLNRYDSTLYVVCIYFFFVVVKCNDLKYLRPHSVPPWSFDSIF